MKKILAILFTMMLSSAHAAEKLTVIQGESPASTNLPMQEIVIKELKKHYDINLITVPSCDKAQQVYENFSDGPVIYMHTGAYQWLRERGKDTCGVPITEKNIWLNVQSAWAICTRSPKIASFIDFKKATKFGTMKPNEINDIQITQMNELGGLNLHAVPYNGGGGLVLTGILNGEIDYGPVAISRVHAAEKDHTLSCFAKFGDSNTEFPSIKSYIPNFKFGDYAVTFVGASKNFDEKQLNALRSIVQNNIKPDTTMGAELRDGSWDVVAGDAKVIFEKYEYQKNLFIQAVK
jgi:hypothetical protein